MMLQELLAETNIGTLITLAALFVLLMSRRRKAASREHPKSTANGGSRSTAGK